METDKKFDAICFCCLTEEGQLKNMADEVITTATLKIQTIEGYTIVSGISPNDEAIKNICATCELKLMASYTFREMCRASYRTLRARHYLGDVDVKDEILSEGSDNDDDFVYDDEVQAEAGDSCQFNQVFVKEPAKKAVDNVVELKTEASDDDSHNPKPTKRVKHKRPPATPADDIALMTSTFLCYYCDQVLSTHNDFQAHRAQHMVRKSYPSIGRVCNLCQQDVKHYVKHIMEYHKDYRPNECHYCEAGRFQNPCDLKNHLSLHLSCEPTHECMACYEKFRNEVMLRTHIAQHKNTDSLYMCPYCGLPFEQFLKCQDHFLADHDATKKLYPCFHCKRIYMVARCYNAHDCPKRTKAPQPDISVKCDQCGTTFSTSEELVCHRSRGCEYDPECHKCKECGKTYGNRKKLLRHLRTHDPTKRSFVCDICGHGTMSVGQLKLHKFRHITDRPFHCQLCPATFKLEAHLRGHQKVHNDKPYECYQCNRQFRTYHNIKQHMAVHSDSTMLRKFACEVCGKNSVSKSTFRTHMRSHTNEHNSKCPLCPKTFGDKAQLKKHYRKAHEGWFYECKFCLKPYKDAIKFRNHLFVHRGFKPYNCPICPSGHIEKYLFVKHLRTHNIDYDDKIHGYREAENIKLLVEECLKNANLKDGGVPAPQSASGVRIVETTIRPPDITGDQQQPLEVEPQQPSVHDDMSASYEPQVQEMSQQQLLCQKRPYFLQYRPNDNHPYQI